jgi:hypothetical protein
MRKINVGILSTKIYENKYFFGFSTMVQNSLKIYTKKVQKKVYFWVFFGTKSPFGQKIFQIFWLHLVPGTTIEKKHTQVVPGTKYGVFQ